MHQAADNFENFRQQSCTRAHGEITAESARMHTTALLETAWPGVLDNEIDINAGWHETRQARSRDLDTVTSSSH